MSQITKYLLFIGILAAASFSAANFDLVNIVGEKPQKTVGGQNRFEAPYISKKPTALLNGLAGQAVLDYSPHKNLTAAAADDLVLVWRLPNATPLQEMDSGDGFVAYSIRFISSESIFAVGGMKSDYTGSVRLFDATTGSLKMQIDEPEPILFLDPHPGGRYLLASGETYIKVLDLKDGNTVTVVQKSNPAARGCYYGNGQYLLQSDTLSLFDLNKRSISGSLGSAAPILFRKGSEGKTFAWLTPEGVTVVTAADGKKVSYTLDTKGITAFDIEPNGRWGVFLASEQKASVVDLASGKSVKTIDLAFPASEVSISGDGSSLYLFYSTGNIAVYDIGHRNKLKNIQFRLTEMLDRVKSKFAQTAKPAPK